MAFFISNTVLNYQLLFFCNNFLLCNVNKSKPRLKQYTYKILIRNTRYKEIFGTFINLIILRLDEVINNYRRMIELMFFFY